MKALAIGSVLLCLLHPAPPAIAAGPGPLAEWTFDAAAGATAPDTSGNGHDAQIHGAKLVKLGEGFALELDGADDYVDCTAAKKLALTGPITVMGWVKPTRPGKGEALLFGEGMASYALTYYNTELCLFYVAGGGNHLKEHLVLNQWQHVAVSFDGQRMNMWINGRLAGSRDSMKPGYKTGGRFFISSSGAADVPRFKGFVDNVRVYDRAVSEEEVLAHVRAEAVDHDLATATASGAAVAETIDFFKNHPNPIDLEQRGDSVVFANRLVGLEVVQTKGGFQLNRLYGVEQEQDYLAAEEVIGLRDLYEIQMIRDPRGSNRDEREKTRGTLMGIVDEMAAGSFPIGSHAAAEVGWEREDGDGETKLHLDWKKIDVQGEKGVVDVRVTVTLRENDPLSRWHFAIRNRSYRWGIERMRFPIVPLAPIGNVRDNVFIYPRERGGLVRDPFNAPTGFGTKLGSSGIYYPVSFNMQFEALYEQGTGKGIYVGTQDPTPNLMNIQVFNTADRITWRVNHFPPNITFAEEDFDLTYECVVGPFTGDWFDAAQMYRDWALKQSWCSKGPLRTREDVPKWYKEAPLMFYTVVADSAEGTWDVEKNMKIAADHFIQFLEWADMRLPINWYKWKKYHRGKSTYDVPFSTHRLYTQGRWKGLPAMNIHDGNYPKIGALDSFASENKRIRDAGGMVCPYVALEIFDQGASENGPYAAEAKEHITRDLYGVMRTWGAETPWQPCAYTPWWQQRMRETASLMTQRENIGGFYLDVMQGSSLPCYWVPHGHTAAGADMTTSSMHKLVEVIREAMREQDPETIITGENSTENMIDVIDGTLSVTLWPENRAPIFAAVYQDYLKRYGTEVSTGMGYKDRYADTFGNDAFFLECASMFVEGMQIGRLRLRPRDAILSFENPGQKPMFAFLEKVIGYYKQDDAKKFLAYGQLMRPLEFAAPSPMPQIEYGGGGGDWPALHSGVFRSHDGELGVFVVNARMEPIDFNAEMDLARHGLAADAVVDVHRVTSGGDSEMVASGVSGAIALAQTLPGRDIAMYRIVPAAER